MSDQITTTKGDERNYAEERQKILENSRQQLSNVLERMARPNENLVRYKYNKMNNNSSNNNNNSNPSNSAAATNNNKNNNVILEQEINDSLSALWNESYSISKQILNQQQKR